MDFLLIDGFYKYSYFGTLGKWLYCHIENPFRPNDNAAEI
jgi:hypothetical protein